MRRFRWQLLIVLITGLVVGLILIFQRTASTPVVESTPNPITGGSYTEALVKANVDSSGRYVYTPITTQYNAAAGTVSFRDPVVQSSSSLWKIQVGVSYEF